MAQRVKDLTLLQAASHRSGLDQILLCLWHRPLADSASSLGTSVRHRYGHKKKTKRTYELTEYGYCAVILLSMHLSFLPTNLQAPSRRDPCTCALFVCSELFVLCMWLVHREPFPELVTALMVQR